MSAVQSACEANNIDNDGSETILTRAHAAALNQQPLAGPTSSSSSSTNESAASAESAAQASEAPLPKRGPGRPRKDHQHTAIKPHPPVSSPKPPETPATSGNLLWLKYKKQHHEIVNIFIDNIQNKFSDSEIKPITTIFAMLKDEVLPEVDWRKELAIYSELVNFSLLEKELKTFYAFKKRVDFKPKASSLISELKTLFVANNFQQLYSQIFILLKIYLTLPVTSAGAERSFSVLKRLKNYLRSTMGQDRLSSLAILDIEYEQTRYLIENGLDVLVDEFATLKERRVNFF